MTGVRMTPEVGSLEHYGVSGMKWGVRQDRGHEGERVKTKKLVKLDRKWEANQRGVKGFIAMHNSVAGKMNNGRLDKVNNKPEFKDVNMWDPKNKKIADKYFKEIGDQQIAAFHESAREMGTNPSGTKRIKITVDRASGSIDASFEDVQHADDFDLSNLHWVGKLDAKGHVISINQVDDVEDLEQSDMGDFDDFLEHYGVVGMKWGQRKKGNAYDIHRARISSEKKGSEYREAKSHSKQTHRANRGVAKAKAQELKVAALKNPDRVLAARLTRGEKIAAAILLTPVGAGLLIGGTSAYSRRIERKQETGAYDKK